jgi:hypothetical protein
MIVRVGICEKSNFFFNTSKEIFLITIIIRNFCFVLDEEFIIYKAAKKILVCGKVFFFFGIVVGEFDEIN